MSLQDITDPDAVRLAAAEFDRIGSEAFLQKYQFGKSRSYFLALNSKLYDSKAIIGAAHGYQFPDIGALLPSQFSGGERTVAKKLEDLGFAVRRDRSVETGEQSSGQNNSVRPPAWNRDELILALEAYVKWNGNPPAKTSKEIGDLSRLTNAIRHMLGTPAQAILRNPNGVYMKLMNFRRLDPVFTGQGKSGLVRGDKLEEEVWRDFYPDPVRLSRVAAAIRATIQAGLSKDPAFMDDSDSAEEMEAVEGRIMTVLHRLRELSKDLVAKRKKTALQQTGKLACEACGFDFAITYGTRGEGFIECHHTKPVETLGDGMATKLSDLALLCANCHRMIHARRPWLSMDELRAYLRR